MKKSKRNPQRRSDGATSGHDSAGKSNAAFVHESGKAVSGGDKPLVMKHTADGESLSRLRFANRISIDSWLVSLPSMLHWIFLLLGIPSFIYFAVCMPPFQAPDEQAHFDRSYQISRGGLYGGSGGYVDRAIDEASYHYSQLPQHPEARLSDADESAAASVKWTGQTVYSSFPNTAANPPIGYLPQALGVALGRIVDMGVVHTLILSRLINGAFAILISALALYWCRRGKLVMFAVLLMPMTMFLFGSCNQDASLISFTCLAFALVSRQISEGVPLALRMTIVLASALLIVSLERPPYIPLLLVFLIPGILPPWGKKPAWLAGFSLAGILAIVTVIWWLAAFSSTHAAVNSSANGTVDARMQFLYIFHHPGMLPAVMIGTSSYFPWYLKEVIGVFGWLDTAMPQPYYTVMEMILLVTFAGEMVYRSRIRISTTAIILFATLSAVIGVFFIEYLTWSTVGSLSVEGVQGRYLIPLAIAGSIGLPRLIRSDKGYRLATAVIVLSQLLTFFYLPKVIIERYYLMIDPPNFIEERLYFADAHQAHGNIDKAVQEYHQVLAIEPDNYDAHNSLGNALAKKGLTQEAIKEFRLSLAIKPDQATPHAEIGWLLIGTHQLPEAVVELTQALRFDPADAHAHNNLAVALFQLGNYEQAVEHFSEAIQIDPAYDEARRNLALAKAGIKNGKVEQAGK